MILDNSSILEKVIERQHVVILNQTGMMGACRAKFYGR
jgi:hypothetical protein